MSGQPFTEEQMLLLRQNPYVFNIIGSRLFLTKEFKEIFISEYKSGETPRSILANHGFDLELLGKRRVWSISEHIRAEYRKYGEFHNGFINPLASPAANNPDAAKGMHTEKDEINRLRHEVEYLRQELEFLKKIFSIRHTQKQGPCS